MNDNGKLNLAAASLGTSSNLCLPFVLLFRAVNAPKSHPHSCFADFQNSYSPVQLEPSEKVNCCCQEFVIFS